MTASDPANANQRAFAAWLDDFFALDEARRPVTATFTGLHAHDRELPDFSPAAISRQIVAMQELRDRLAGIPPDTLSESQQHDRLLTDGHLQLQIMEAGLPQFHSGNPAHYTGEGVFSVIALFLRDSEPLEDRIAASISRMHAMPAFLEQARQNVPEAPPAWTERALREARSATIYFQRGLPRLAVERGIADPAFLAAARVAHEAFATHATWLEQTLLRQPAGKYAAGRVAFDNYLRFGHCLPSEHDAAWVLSYAQKALDAEKEALERGAKELDQTRSADELLTDLANHHPAFKEYPSSFGRVWDAARQNAIDHELLTWPDYPIDYVPVPETDREAAAGLYYLPYRCPPPFGQPEVQRYLIPTIPADLSPDEREQRLRAVNDSVIKLNHVVHHGGLGHHVQNWHAFRAKSRIGQRAGVDAASRIAYFCGGTLVEGWACYATDLMDETGFLTPLESLAQHQSRLRMAGRAIADVNIHTGAMTLDEAATFYRDEVGMPGAAAQAEAVKNSMFPGAAMMYLIGTDAIHDLRREVAARDSEGFSLRRFHDQFLSYGAIPVPLIQRSLLRE